MAEKKMTRVEALNVVLGATREGFEAEEMTEAREVLRKMVEQLSKPRKKSEGPSKARRENEILAHALAEAIEAHGEKVTPKWVTEHVKGILTPQKAVAVAKVAEELELVKKSKEGKTTYYEVA
jgi:hypothetical protein